MQSETLLQIKQLNAGYGAIQILWDVNLDVNAGEIVALLGSNGAGKTTLLATISRLVAPRSGKISFAGQEITTTPADKIVAQGLVHVPQGRRLFAGLTVRENLLQGAFVRRDRANIKRDLERVLDFFPAIARRLDLPAGKLSGGEQQMVAIGRGLMGNPKLLMVDELSLGLAPLVVDTIINALEEFNRDLGTALLLVEQDVQVALEHAQRGYVLETGRIVLEGTAQVLRRDPHVRAAYLGA